MLSGQGLGHLDETIPQPVPSLPGQEGPSARPAQGLLLHQPVQVLGPSAPAPTPQGWRSIWGCLFSWGRFPLELPSLIFYLPFFILLPRGAQEVLGPPAAALVHAVARAPAPSAFSPWASYHLLRTLAPSRPGSLRIHAASFACWALRPWKPWSSSPRAPGERFLPLGPRGVPSLGDFLINVFY